MADLPARPVRHAWLLELDDLRHPAVTGALKKTLVDHQVHGATDHRGHHLSRQPSYRRHLGKQLELMETIFRVVAMNRPKAAPVPTAKRPQQAERLLAPYFADNDSIRSLAERISDEVTDRHRMSAPSWLLSASGRIARGSADLGVRWSGNRARNTAA